MTLTVFRIGIIGSGLGGMITAMELAEAGHKVQIFDSRRFVGGKVGSWVDKDGDKISIHFRHTLFEEDI
jgi:zeta-carotene desaturase